MEWEGGGRGWGEESRFTRTEMREKQRNNYGAKARRNKTRERQQEAGMPKRKATDPARAEERKKKAKKRNRETERG